MFSPIIRIILLLIFLASIIFCGFFVYKLPNKIANGITKYLILQNAESIAKFYDEILYRRYDTTITSLLVTPKDLWQKNDSFQDFINYSSSYSKYFNVLAINLYLPNKVEILRNNQLRSDEYDAGRLIDELQTQKSTYRILENIDLVGTHFTNHIEKLVQIILPIEYNGSKIYIEILYDISLVNNFIKKDILYFGYGNIIILVIAYCLFGYSFRRNLQLIASQHDFNQKLTDAVKKAEEDNSDKSKFIANVSHELRTPLNSIIGFSDIILKEELGPVGTPEYKEYLTNINNAGNHLLGLINDILDYSKAEAGKLNFDLIETNLNKIVQTCLRIMQPKAADAKVNMIDQISNTVINFNTDPKRLKQVFLNILSNSVKFTPENGSITISAIIDEKSKKLFIKIQDTGIGIAAKDIAKAMSTFGQIDNKRSRQYEGTGLGLPLTKKLVELMQGEFQIDSEVGYGTTITLIFPI